MKVKNREGGRATAWIVTAQPEPAQVLMDLSRLCLFKAQLVNPEDDAVGEVSSSDVVVQDSNAERTPFGLLELPRIVVELQGPGQGQGKGQGRHPGDVSLPGGEAELLRLLSNLGPRTKPEDHTDDQVLLVGAWHGGGGATTTAFALAKASGAVLVDAAGNRSGWVPLEEGIGWKDLKPDDLPGSARLVSALPRQQGVPTLAPDLAVPVTPEAEVVTAVVATVPGRAVVDCGTNADGLNSLACDLESIGKTVAVAMVGSATDYGIRALAAFCAAGPVQGPVTFLLRGRKGPLFAPLVRRFDLEWARVPKASSFHRWARLQAAIWAE